MVSDFAFTPGKRLGHRKGPCSPHVREGIHRHGPHGRNEAVHGFRLDDRLPDPAGQFAARPLRVPVQAGEGTSTHSDPNGGSTSQC